MLMDPLLGSVQNSYYCMHHDLLRLVGHHQATFGFAKLAQLDYQKMISIALVASIIFILFSINFSLAILLLFTLLHLLLC